MEKLYTVNKKKRPEADCGSDHEFLTAKFRLKLRKVGKTTRSFRYDLNHIPYDYTEEVTNRFKGLELIDRVPEELWTEVHDIIQEAVIKTISKEKVRTEVTQKAGNIWQARPNIFYSLLMLFQSQ